MVPYNRFRLYVLYKQFQLYEALLVLVLSVLCWAIPPLGSFGQVSHVTILYSRESFTEDMVFLGAISCGGSER